ncbi:MAG: hypothetical protein WC498_02040 [Candidatus Saccharimonadales bacterium]
MTDPISEPLPDFAVIAGELQTLTTEEALAKNELQEAFVTTEALSAAARERAAIRRAKTTEALERVRALADTGELHGEELVSTVSQLVESAGDKNLIDHFEADMAFRQQLTPGQPVYCVYDAGESAVYIVSEDQDQANPVPVIDQDPYRVRQHPQSVTPLPFAFKVQVKEPGGPDSQNALGTFSLSNSTVGVEAITTKLEEKFENARDKALYRDTPHHVTFRDMRDLARNFASLGKDKKAADCRERATKSAECALEEYLKHSSSSNSYLVESLAYLAEHALEKYEQLYENQAEEIASSNLTRDLDKKTNFARLVVEAQNPDYKYLRTFEKNKLLLEMVSELNNHGAEILTVKWAEHAAQEASAES